MVALKGVAVWHMRHHNEEIFLDKFSELLSLLKELGRINKTETVWMQQYPVIEEGFKVLMNKTQQHDITSGKIYRFNESIKQSLA